MSIRPFTHKHGISAKFFPEEVPAGTERYRAPLDEGEPDATTGASAAASNEDEAIDLGPVSSPPSSGRLPEIAKRLGVAWPTLGKGA